MQGTSDKYRLKSMQVAGWKAVQSHTSAKIKDIRKTIRTIERVAG